MKIDRLIGILSVLLQQDKVTAPRLAEKFEVSRRTITRDLDALGKAGIPIVTTQGKNGGISIMEGYRLDRTLLTAVDMQAIMAGLKSLDSVSRTSRYRRLMDKLGVGKEGGAGDGRAPGQGDTGAGQSGSGRGEPLGGKEQIDARDEQILIDLASWYRPTLSSKIEQIQEAIGRRERIRFDYYAPSGESRRRIEPYRLIFQWSSWYVWGYCMEREDFRMFKLNRLWELQNTGEVFTPRERPEWERDSKIFPGVLPASVRVSSQMKWRLVEEYGVDSFSEQEDGTLLFCWKFADKESLFCWILSFGTEAELLEPEELRRELAGRLEEMAEKYRKGSAVCEE